MSLTILNILILSCIYLMVILSGCLTSVVCFVCSIPWSFLMVDCFLERFKFRWLSTFRLLSIGSLCGLGWRCDLQKALYHHTETSKFTPLAKGFLYTAGSINLNWRTPWQQTCGYNFSGCTFLLFTHTPVRSGQAWFLGQWSSPSSPVCSSFYV